MSGSDPKSIFSLEVTSDSGQLRVSAYLKTSEDKKTVRQYETKETSDAETGRTCAAIVRLLNRANRQGKLEGNNLKELKTCGQLLYDGLLTAQAKKKMAETKAEHLIVIVDDHLVHIPWELLFDGNSFLCRRFNMGRIVRTSQRISNSEAREVRTPLKMLLVADPRHDLEEAYREGLSLRDELDKDIDIIEVDLRSSIVDAPSVRGALRHYDILHYAGHADYDMNAPSDSGFLMDGGKLTALDIMSMTGPSPLPALVFSNACRSGHTDMWRVGDDYETEIYGLANAFLLAGVQHYIGTFWDVRDEPSHHFAADFYRELIKGSMVGEAVKKARQASVERYGEDTITWASYMLYGDPTVRYVETFVSAGKEKTAEDAESKEGAREDAAFFAGSVRGADTRIVFPRKKSRWIALISVLIIIIVSYLVYFLSGGPKADPPSAAPPVSQDLDKDARQRRTDELVAALIKDYRENRKRGGAGPPAGIMSGSPTLVFLNVKANGITEADKEYVLTAITGALRNSKRLKVVEREIINTLLEELKLSSSELADPARVLEVGKILTAQVIATGSISRDGRQWQVSLRFIDTETTTIQAALTETVETGDKEEVAAVIGKEILRKFGTGKD